MVLVNMVIAVWRRLVKMVEVVKMICGIV